MRTEKHRQQQKQAIANDSQESKQKIYIVNDENDGFSVSLLLFFFIQHFIVFVQSLDINSAYSAR